MESYALYGNRLSSRHRAREGLLMTDAIALLALFLAALWVLDPLRLSLDHLTVIKHLPLLLLGCALVVAATGRALFARREGARPLEELGLALWPMMLFALAVLGGSLYGRLFQGVDNSFLNMGLLMLTLPAVAWFVRVTPDPARWTRCFYLAIGAVAALDGLLQWAHFAGDTYFHGVEFAVIPLATWCWFGIRNAFWRAAATLFFISLAAAEHKNTGILLGLLVVAYCGYWSLRGQYRRARDHLARERQAGWAVFTGMSLLAFGASVYALRKLLLPDGNPKYRLHTYQKALDKFTDSPLIGNAFTGPATERFELFQVSVSRSNVLPTHSDPLDILANGGVAYSLLFLYGAWKLLWLMACAVYRAEADPELRPPYAAALHTSLVTFMSGIIVFSFNPVLTQPNSALVFWAATGVGLGLALRTPAAQARVRSAARPARPAAAPRMRGVQGMP